MAFNWKTLIVAILIFAALTSIRSGWSKWVFAIVMIGILLTVGQKILPKTT